MQLQNYKSPEKNLRLQRDTYILGKSVLHDQATHVGRELVDFRPTNGELLVKCRPLVGRLTADMCRLVLKYTFTYILCCTRLFV